MTKTYPARFFAPGAAAQGTRVQVELRSRLLCVREDSGREHEVAYAALRPRAGGWDGGSLFLEWDAEAGTAALSFADVEAREVAAAAPEALRARLAGVRRPTRRRLGLFVGLAAVVVVIAALLLADFAGGLVDPVVRRIPPDWEAELGGAMAAQMTAGRESRAEGATRFLRDTTARLAAEIESPYAFHVHLLEDAQVNALALPGGSIVFFTGLLRAADTPEEVAGVLAHEMQHVVQRHGLRALVRSLGWRTLLMTLFGGPGEAAGWAAGAVEQLAGLRYSRAQEAEADVEGARLLQRAGIDVLGLADFFTKLGARSEVPALLSTHPASDDRARRIRALAGPASGPPLDVDWRQIRAELEEAAGR